MIKFVTMNQSGKLKLETGQTPELEVGGILLKTLYSEVCGTDVHLSHLQLAGVPYPIIPGHVSTGIIDQINGEIKDVEGSLLNIGDVVTFLDVHETCNSCYYCLVAKETTRCPSRKVYGITYSSTEGLLGGWSQYIYLKPKVKVLKLTSKELAKKFIAGGCGLPTSIHAVERTDIKLGDTIVVQGSGPVGLMAAILCKHSGAHKVVLVGGPQHRLDVAKKFGIIDVINIEQLDVEARRNRVLELTNGRGADKIIEATGIPSAITEGLRFIRDGGTYVIVGQYTDAGNISVNPHLDINKKHLTIKGCWGSDFSHFYKAVQFIAQNAEIYPWEEIITRSYTLEEVDEALDDVKNYRVMKAIIEPNR